METTLFIAKLLGVMYLIVGLGVLLNGKHFKKMIGDYMKSPALSYFSGIAVAVAMLAALMYHNIWSGYWYTILVTVFLWIGFVKGIVLVVMPVPLMKLSDMIFKKLNLVFAGILILLMGALFSYIGFYI
jgi:hypothetical protein